MWSCVRQVVSPSVSLTCNSSPHAQVGPDGCPLGRKGPSTLHRLLPQSEDIQRPGPSLSALCRCEGGELMREGDGVELVCIATIVVSVDANLLLTIFNLL